MLDYNVFSIIGIMGDKMLSIRGIISGFFRIIGLIISAFATLISVAGPGGKTIVFEGFLSPKPGRRRSRLRELLATGWAFVLYESPYRIVKLLQDIADIESERNVVVGRELTKLHEEIVEGSAADVLENFSSRSKILGEFAIFVAGNKNAQVLEETSDK